MKISSVAGSVRRGYPIHGTSFATILDAEIFEDREYVGWGSDLANGGVISPEVLDRACFALKHLVEESARMGCKEPVLCGTNVFRQALNRVEAKGRLEHASGLEVKVLSEKGEAVFGFIGASSSIDCSDGCTVIDLGGTSTEICTGRGSLVDRFSSLKAGTHSVVRDLPRRSLDMYHYRRVLLRYVELLDGSSKNGIEFESIESLFSGGAGSMLATGGTAVSIAVLAGYIGTELFDPFRGYLLSFDSFVSLRNRIVGLYERGLENGLPLDRARIEVLVPGMLLLEAIWRVIGTDEIFITARDLRWGIVLNGSALKGDLVVS